MVRMRLMPHQEADPDSVEWGQWWVSTGGERSAADAIVEGWDYSTPLVLEIQPSVDEDAFLDSTGLPSLDTCEIVAMLECPSTGLRHMSRRSLATTLQSPDRVLRLEPPLGSLAQRVALSCHIVLARNLSGTTGRTAHLAGSRIAESPTTTLVLEGDVSRFPTESVSFKAMGYDSALWTLRHDLSEPDEPFASAVRLFINSDHPSSDALVDSNHTSHKLLQSALEVDVVRQLVWAAAQQRDDFQQSTTWSEGSTGAALETLAASHFQRSLDDLISLTQQDQSAFERLLQSRLNAYGAAT